MSATYLAAAARLLGLYRLAGRDSRRLGSSRRRCGAHPVLDLFGHGQERLFNVSCVLCGRLEEWNRKLIREFLGNAVFDNFLVRQIRLIPNEQLINAFRRVSINFLQPLLHICKRIVVRNVVNDDDTVGPPVVRRSDCPEAFLACCIPLQIGW